MKYRVQVVIEEELLGKTVAALSQLGLTLSVKAVAQGVTEVHYEEAPRPAPESKPEPDPEPEPEAWMLKPTQPSISPVGVCNMRKSVACAA